MRKTIAHFVLTGTMMLVLLGAAPAQASPVYIQGTGLGVSGLEFQAPYYFRSFAGQVLLDTGLAGASDDFIGWCVDASRSRVPVQDMVIRPLSELPDNGNPSSSVQPNAGARIAWLINAYSNDDWLLANNLADANNRAAALQLAIWEVLYEPFGSYNIANGNFVMLYSSIYPALVSYTNQYFTNLGTNTSEAFWYDNINLQQSTGQDFAVDPPTVPDSGSTIVLLGSSLLALARAARHRRPRQQ
jgi:hypothetical protein